MAGVCHSAGERLLTKYLRKAGFEEAHSSRDDHGRGYGGRRVRPWLCTDKERDMNAGA